jgi:hypothetical protein
VIANQASAGDQVLSEAALLSALSDLGQPVAAYAPLPTDGLVPVSTIRGGTCSVAHDETWSRVVRGFLPGQTSASAAHAAPSGPGD